MIEWIIRKLSPAIVWIGKQHMPFSHKKIDGEFYYKHRDLIQPGMILLSKAQGELSNLINIGKMKHTAIYVGGNEIKYVVEAIGEGVVKTPLVDFLLTKDHVMCLRFKHKFKREKVLRYVHSCIGYSYDWGFALNKKREKYCSELAYDAYNEASDVDLCYEEMYGYKYVVPDCFLKDENNWTTVFDSEFIDLYA